MSGFAGPPGILGVVWPGVIVAFPVALPPRVAKSIFWFRDLCLRTWWNSQFRPSPFPHYKADWLVEYPELLA